MISMSIDRSAPEPYEADNSGAALADFSSVVFPAVADDMGCGPRMFAPGRVEYFHRYTFLVQ